jgi:very-short-patch-repair endonuclease
MDVFQLRDRLIEDYGSFVRSYIRIRDPRIADVVERELAAGRLWPAPLIQLNPAFRPGATIDQLVAEEVLHEECGEIFRRGKGESDTTGEVLRLHTHQEEAIRVARGGHNYVLTTGTGSGKSLAYIVPIVDSVLREGSGKGVRAIIVYPMNALANSQLGELEKFLKFGYGQGKEPVRFARYTGQEGQEERDEIIANPPDVILTNYVMLELMLTRPEERKLVTAAEGLRYLVLDELHTYRGRQGADVAYLVRRVRDRMGADALQCVGTSATVAGSGTAEEQQAEVASVAAKLFGSPVHPSHVIGETLRRSTPERDESDSDFLQDLRERIERVTPDPAMNFEGYVADPLSSWLETTVGVRRDPTSPDQLVRALPKPLIGEEGLASRLATLTNLDSESCRRAIESHLLAGYQSEPNPETGFPPFAFRLHQFVSRGDTVYATPEVEGEREITLEGGRFVPNDRSRGYLPLVFCRECGQEYYCVTRAIDEETGAPAFQPRNLSERKTEGDSEAGFLYISESKPWPSDPEDVAQRLPEDWLEDGTIKRHQRERVPRQTAVDGLGRVRPEGTEAYFIPTPFRFCLGCGVEYSHYQRSDFGKLASLATEGRSSAITVLALSAIRYLKDSDLPSRAQKLLSFTDNRQDASLQAGHLNDFVEIGLLRAATYRAALDAGPDGLAHDELTQSVFDALDLPFAAYASNPDAAYGARRNTEKAFRDVLGYRLYRDLKRGWRVTLPNLEQCGLLEIQYPDLAEICADEVLWADTHPAFQGASPAIREHVCRTFLDHLRRELAIKVDFLDTRKQERVQQSSFVSLKEPWALDDQEQMVHAAIVFPRPGRRDEFRGWVYLSPRGGFGFLLRRGSTFPQLADRPSVEDAGNMIRELCDLLVQAGLLEQVTDGNEANTGDEEHTPGYQLVASAFRWVAGEGTRPFHDPIRVPQAPEEGSDPNPFFTDFYRKTAEELLGIEAREHTAQVRAEDRERREERFRAARLPILFCSPTMELGVDIAQLNVVNLRNVPPTPANYAQRSGRAGRSGQPALVFTYCSTYSAHDQYFFRRPDQMVQGAVAPPRLDLANEDLVRSHVHSVWLAETGMGLGRSLRDVLDVEGEEPSLNLLPSIAAGLDDRPARDRALSRIDRILSSASDELQGSGWYSPSWAAESLGQVPLHFEEACERWKDLYRAAREQYVRQSRIRVDHSRTERDRREATRLQRDAAAQLELLTDVARAFQSDFYSYRYFASEGFLPGYAFPRLPLSAFIPGRRTSGDDREFVSRPRFLAISEFGPRAFVYHEGGRYQINRVILSVDEEQDPTTTRMKQCEHCGYVHPITAGDGVDQCEACGKPLPPPLQHLLRLHNVATRRRDRINADEEERTRYGYEIRTGFRFGRIGVHTAQIESDDRTLAQIRYGHPARLFRINLGWTRRENPNEVGFVLDVERGYWASNKAMEENDPDDPMSGRLLRVLPYVEDWKNALLFEPTDDLSVGQMASLQAALKNAIQVEFQLEDRELAAEALPDRDDRRFLLFYEAAEGGAGVLRRLVDDSAAFTRVARRALELCHFDPETGDDLRRAPGARDDCEAACYDCLMSYQNQLDHERLDRVPIRDFLITMAGARIEAAQGSRPRSELLDDLLRRSETQLEKRWLHAVDERHLRLPCAAQERIVECRTRPDFLYRDKKAAIYVDGPHHEFPERAARDSDQQNCLEDLGYSVLRFAHDDDWNALFDRYTNIFGAGDA